MKKSILQLSFLIATFFTINPLVAQQAIALTCSGYLRAKFKLMMEPREWPKQMTGLLGCLFFASFTISF